MVHDPPNSLPLSLPFPASVQSSSSRTLRCSCSEIRWLSLIRWHRGLHGTPCHPPIPGETSIFVARPLLFHRKNRAKFLGVAAIYERWMENIYIYFGWWIQVEVINKYHLRIGPWDLSLFHWGRRPTKTVLPGKRWSIPKGMWFLPWKEIPDVEKYTRYNHPLKKSDIGRKLPKKWIKMTGSSCGWLVDAKKKAVLLSDSISSNESAPNASHLYLFRSLLSDSSTFPGTSDWQLVTPWGWTYICRVKNGYTWG